MSNLPHSESISYLLEVVRSFRDKREWSIYHKPKDLAISIAIEAAELLELFQWLSDQDIEQLKRSQKFISRISEEIADILIYLLSLVDILGIDIVEQVNRKIKINETKYPPEKFGGTKFKEWLFKKYL